MKEIFNKLTGHSSGYLRTLIIVFKDKIDKRYKDIKVEVS